MKCSTPLAIAMLCFPVLAHAIDSGRNWKPYGVVAQGGVCRDLNSASESERLAYEQWLLGYISGINRERKGKPDYALGADGTGLTSWITTHCQNMPDMSITQAVDELLKELNDFDDRSQVAPSK